MNDAKPPPLDEIRALIGSLPAWPEAVAESGTADAAGSLGLLDGLAAWAAAGQGRTRLRLDRPRAALFLGNWAADDAGAALASLDAVRTGQSRLNALCRHNDAELRVYEMAVDGAGAALGPDECATAMAYGMTTVEDGLDLLCLAAAGPGRAQTAAALTQALLDRSDDPLEALARHGGHALAALAGAALAARMARVPVILDGFAPLASAAVLSRLDDTALDHCALAQPLDGPGPRRLQDALGKEAVLDLAVAAEDGSAALLVLGLLRAALAGPAPD